MENQKIIVYCFLTYNDIERIDIWEKYFKHKTNFKVYIHSKEKIQPYKYSFPVNIIQNPINTISKSHISIVRATLHLLKEAYNNTPEASHFIFLTQSCIPVYSFDFHYDLITKLNKSLMSLIMGNKVERYNSLSFNFKKNIPNKLFIKQQPNMLLTKEDVKWFIENDYTEDFKNLECPDEHYFINLFLHIYKKEFIKQQILYCNNDISRTQAENFYIVNKYVVNRVRVLGCLFLRKVNKFSRIDSEYIGLD